jgi:hypothetical protein
MTQPYFWLGASADAETGSRARTEPASSLRPTGFDPARFCRACGRAVCLTAQRMFCGCQTVPWEIQEEGE